VREQLNYLFDRDTSSRWRIILITALSVALFGFVSQFSGVRMRDAQRNATILGALVFSVQVLVYVAPAHQLRRGLALRARVYLIRAAAAVTTCAGLALLASTSGPALQGAILGRRLRQTLASKHPDVLKAANILLLAGSAEIILNEHLVKQTVEIAKLNNAWSTYMAALNYVISTRSQRFEFSGTVLDTQGLTHHPATQPCGQENNILLRLPEEGYGISTCRLRLDRQQLKGVHLVAVTAEYDGGAVDLERVQFLWSTLQMPDTPNTRLFAEALLQSDNNTVTFRAN
jgi:hypothetical protein